MFHARHLILALSVGCLLLTGSVGCNKPTVAKGVNARIRPLAILFLRFTSQHRGKSPQNREELEKFIDTQGPRELEAFGIKKMEDLFVSERDEQPYVVRYGIDIPPPGPNGQTAVAYESKGLNGNRLVVFSTAGVEEVGTARLKQLVPDAQP